MNTICFSGASWRFNPDHDQAHIFLFWCESVAFPDRDQFILNSSHDVISILFVAAVVRPRSSHISHCAKHQFAMLQGSKLCKRAVKYHIHFPNKEKMEQNEKINVERVLVDPDNRDEIFVTLEDVLQRGERICGLGFDLRRVRVIVT